MMEHIQQFDWCSSDVDRDFVTPKGLDNCVTEKILRNKFYDPLASSSSENEGCEIDWDTVFAKKKDNEKSQKIFVPGLHPVPPYPKKSALTPQQHYQCLKVLCQEYPHILPNHFIPRPTKTDHKVFEQIKETYEKEQKEYLEWAKSLWTNNHCIRALRPKPVVETVYDAEFKMRAQEAQSFPKTWHVAAQIPLDMRDGVYEMLLQEDLININISDLPQIEYPAVIKERLSIMRPPSIPEPCVKHPCRFVLPGENSVTILPATEIHRILAQYGADYGAQYVCGAGALRCLLDAERAWALPLSVCEAVGADGEKNNVIVLGSEFAIHKETSKMRTYRASKHLLEYAFIPASEKAKMMERHNDTHDSKDNDVSISQFLDSDDVTSDEEGDSLIIDPGDYKNIGVTDQDYVLSMDEDTCDQDYVMDTSKKTSPRQQEKEEKPPVTVEKRVTRSSDISDIGIYTCCCKDTIFEKPPPRSFKKWIVKNKSANETYDVIVHCSHKTRNGSEEVVLEPTVEYQVDLGMSQMSQSKMRTLALSMMLRQNATLLNVVVDGGTGDVVSVAPLSPAQRQELQDVTSQVTRILCAALAQLQGLVPDNYVLLHEARHGANALLLSPRSVARGGSPLTSLAEVANDEAQGVKAAPILGPALLPYHKHRRTLPCAFTPYEDQVAKEPKKPATRQKTPPQAIKWPKRKRKRAKR